MNAKQEFLQEIKEKTLICARISFEDNIYILKNNYSKKDFNDFCDKIDFEYDAGYGGQNLFGVILFKDSYSDRGEYDGSEWWSNHKKPKIKDILGI